MIRLGWLNHVVGPLLTIGGIHSRWLVCPHPIYHRQRYACTEGRHSKIGDTGAVCLFPQPDDSGCLIDVSGYWVLDEFGRGYRFDSGCV